jgi:hypothetical protein
LFLLLFDLGEQIFRQASRPLSHNNVAIGFSNKEMFGRKLQSGGVQRRLAASGKAFRAQQFKLRRDTPLAVVTGAIPRQKPAGLLALICRRFHRYSHRLIGSPLDTDTTQALPFPP